MPERLDHFMARANTAYYAAQDPFQDFTTAPEITQVFGELLGAWAAIMWQAMGAPDPVLLVEAGAGRGTLMADMLRIGRVAPAFRDAARVHFIETSPRLRAAQAAKVPQATWHDTLVSVPPGIMILIANEFLDALPVRQFAIQGGAWRERHVEAGASVWLPAAPGAPVPSLAPRGARREVREVNEAALGWVGAVAGRLASAGGVALILDYGAPEGAPDGGAGDTLQALRNGVPADPLADPGQADLTAHVDFGALAKAVLDGGAVPHGPVPQGAFLHALGLRARTERLCAAHPDRTAALRDASDRLANPNRMGSLFQVLAVTPAGNAPPPGLRK